MRLQVLDLLSGQLKHEVFWKAFDVAPDLLVQASCFDAVKLCQVGVQHNFLLADDEDALLNPLGGY